MREQQRQRQYRHQMQPRSDVRSEDTAISTSLQTLPQKEKPCFPIMSIILTGDSAELFQFELNQTLEQSGFEPGMCLGVKGINLLMTLTQNAIIARGYTTTRVFAAAQDLKSGHLELTVVPGRIHSIRYDQSDKENTHAYRIARLDNEFPAQAGDILNLRDLEQGLENLKRVPTAEVDIQIVPAEAPNESDVVIRWSQRAIPFRITLNADDSGSRATGRYQGMIALSADSPLGLSDLFYASYNHHLGRAPSQIDENRHRIKSGTHGSALHYSVPFGNWLWAINHSTYTYHQAIAGISQNYDYNGKSTMIDAGFTRLLYRDAHRKITLGPKLWRRDSSNYIDDTEIPLQRRRTFGWALNFDHKEYIGNATMNLGLGYKRGTGGGGSLRAPEEATHEGTSRPKIVTTDVELNWPFAVGKQIFAYDSSVSAQWSPHPLILLDRFSLGGRYTVRGFDGETMLAAERGGYWRNTLSWQHTQNHQFYLGADVGRVSGPSASMLAGQTLAGAVAGVKGGFSPIGRLYYDVFIGAPLFKPKRFETDSYTAGFTLNYSL